MRNKMGDDQELHIAININYVCPKISSPNSMGCQQAVPAILYEGQTLWVYYPGMKSPKELKGIAKR
ncbi:DddA-like double-stranded DNA deaminase toxin [Streptomyces cyaneofuscatus]|uniref:DddA-like double-stranded DNA deaminase toxin n=1 Tax=Streptomyces cyaneofuscatus TaxID=66883 RepID=UPI0033BBADFA